MVKQVVMSNWDNLKTMKNEEWRHAMKNAYNSNGLKENEQTRNE